MQCCAESGSSGAATVINHNAAGAPPTSERRHCTSKLQTGATYLRRFTQKPQRWILSCNDVGTYIWSMYLYLYIYICIYISTYIDRFFLHTNSQLTGRLTGSLGRWFLWVNCISDWYGNSAAKNLHRKGASIHCDIIHVHENTSGRAGSTSHFFCACLKRTIVCMQKICCMDNDSL